MRLAPALLCAALLSACQGGTTAPQSSAPAAKPAAAPAAAAPAPAKTSALRPMTREDLETMDDAEWLRCATIEQDLLARRNAVMESRPALQKETPEQAAVRQRLHRIVFPKGRNFQYGAGLRYGAADYRAFEEKTLERPQAAWLARLQAGEGLGIVTADLPVREAELNQCRAIAIGAAG